MGFYIAIFVFLAIFNGVPADDPECPGPFNPPNNISTKVVYPVSNGTVTFPTGYNCVYQINVPQGWSSYVVVTAIPSFNLTNSPILQVIDSNQNVESFQYVRFEKFYFIAPGGRIKLSTQTTNVTFLFSVQWYSNLTVSQPTFLNVNASDSQPSTVGVSTVNCHVTAETRASAVTIPLDSGLTIEDQRSILRSILIFDGPNVNSTCLGSAYQLWNSNRQFVSTGKTLTIIELQPLDYYYSQSILLIQDFENTKEIGQYRGVESLGNFPIVMDASKHASAFSTYADAGLLSDCLINITGTGTLDVYNGGKTDSKSNLIASYSESSNGVNLPQKIRGVVRTYVLTGGIASVQILPNSFCRLLTNNVAGFITSREYKTNLTIPYSEDRQSYYSDGPFNYTLNIQNVDLSQNKSLSLSIYNNHRGVVDFVYNSSSPPSLNTVLSGVGNEMEVIYSSPYSNSKKGGFYIDFTATKGQESVAKSFAVIVVCAILCAGFF